MVWLWTSHCIVFLLNFMTRQAGICIFTVLVPRPVIFIRKCLALAHENIYLLVAGPLPVFFFAFSLSGLWQWTAASRLPRCLSQLPGQSLPPLLCTSAIYVSPSLYGPHHLYISPTPSSLTTSCIRPDLGGRRESCGGPS